MSRLLAALCALTLCAAWPAQSGEQMTGKQRDFVAANLVAIYYHELGHALIDIMELPIFGQEEDAADVLSAVLIHDFYKEATAQRIARATAVGFLGDRSISEAQRARVNYWDVHGPDLQRYYTFVCLIFGANPRERRSLARELRLPEGRMKTCPEEFAQAENAWGPVIQRLIDAGPGKSIRFLADYRVGEYGRFTAEIIRREVDTMNAGLSLPKRLLVRVEDCEQVNAFYDPGRREIIMCNEFTGYLAEVTQ